MLLAAPLLVLLTGCAADGPPAAPAELPPSPWQGFGSLARYAQNLQTVYAHGVDISSEMDDAEAQIALYVDGELPEPEMRRRIADARSRARYEIDEYRTWLYTLPPRPRFRDPQREAGLRAAEDMVRGLSEILEAKWQLLDRLMQTALGGDAGEYDIASADSLVLARRLIDAENTALEAALLGANANHPQRGVYQASIGSNLAVRAALILVEDSLRGRESRLADARDGIERGLERAARGIETGRRDADAMLAQFGGRTAVTESDRISRRFITDMVAAYHRAFDDETRIVDVMRRFLDDLVAAMETPEGDAFGRLAVAAQTFEDEIAALVDARLEEQIKRLRLVEEFSAALAAP